LREAVPASRVVALGKEPVSISLLVESGVDILPPLSVSRTGDSNRNLKIVAVEAPSEKWLRMDVEGLSGAEYTLQLANAGKVRAVKGAELEKGKLLVKMPAGPAGEFLKATIEMELR